MSDPVHPFGAATIQRVVERSGPGFPAAVLLPDWDPAVLDHHPELFEADCFDRAESRFISSIHTWVVRTRHHTILIDSCVGNAKHRPAVPRFHQLDTPFLDRLAQAGVTPEQVDYVLCTHLHADHCGWNTRLLDGRWVPTFPRARYVFSKAEHDHWSGPAGQQGFNAGVYADSVLPVVEAGQALIVDGTETDGTGLRGAGPIGDELLLHPTPGHSPGHVAIRLLDRGREALFCGDAMHQPVQVVRPDWSSGFCTDPAAARDSRRWVLEHAAERGATLFTAHFPRSSAGHVSSTGGRFDWRFL